MNQPYRPDYEIDQPQGRPDPLFGLTAGEVQQRISAGQVNTQPDSLTPSIGEIVRKNSLTLFNLINVVLAVINLIYGELKDVLFLGIALANTVMGIFQELRAKRTLDKLKILAENKVLVMRDGRQQSLSQEEIVLDEVMILQSGNQICADGVVLESVGLQVDESLLTGESDKIIKQPGDRVMSGSFVTGGHAYIRVDAVGKDSYATKLTIEAKKVKKPSSQLMRMLNTIIRVLTIIIIPMGILLFYSQYQSSGNIAESVLGSTAAILGMIPEGLILLTSVTLTVGALNLARQKALVQSLPSIETLARVDVMCLDKTGTITDGTLSFEQFELYDGFDQNKAETAVAALMGALQDNNATAEALRSTFGSSAQWSAMSIVPFSSDRKWSGATFHGHGSYVIGAPGFVFQNQSLPFFEQAHSFAEEGYRVLCLAHTMGTIGDGLLPADIQCKALIVLSDTIRKEAPDTFRYFEKEGVLLKVISGDDPVTVSTIAAKAGLKEADMAVDMSRLPENTDYRALVRDYTVFGRVSPQQKKALIRALKENGHTTCMTGDGVNDVPAMKEADCSVSMVGGSDAARSACDFVLMTSNFASMVNILKEGRRVINNIENVSALYLVKTIYSALLTLIFIFMATPYPFSALQMSPINTFTIGIPSFVLALRANYNRPEGKFLSNVMENSFPAAITVVINVLVAQLAAVSFDLSNEETSTMIVLLTAAVGFVLLTRIARPLNKPMIAFIAALGAAFLIFFVFFGEFFRLESLFNRNAFFYLPLLYASPHLFRLISSGVQKAEQFLVWARERKKKPGHAK